MDLKIEKGMAVEEVISILTRSLVEFCISLVVAILVFYAGRFLIRKIYGVVSKLMNKRHVDASIMTFVLSGVQIVLYFILIIIVVGILGMETSSFIALFASAGVAIGMALSGMLQNFAGGVLILFLKPYKVGDYVEAQGFAGTVKAIKMFNTEITTPDNKTIIIPNGPLFTGSINNYSFQPRRRVDWTVGVAYGTDFEQAKSVILSILEANAAVIKNDSTAPMAVFLKELADSAVVLTVRAWVKEEDYWAVFYNVNEQIYKLLPENGVQFPFPQLDVHMIPADGSAQA
ncbi:MAG: mechanosensitive ion channel [Bacteroidales bacterium]|nr:mechanosensitive ion channel [Bacteroidales bacterium]MBD5282931.1 mechanosensitive ion channel [Bacteroides sp.]MBD5365289.1 mechanosensitive ion channel [Bacteroides sp.]MBD5372269.1 mechanosensitive ion channel [Bacteroides sp.]